MRIPQRRGFAERAGPPLLGNGAFSDRRRSLPVIEEGSARLTLGDSGWSKLDSGPEVYAMRVEEIERAVLQKESAAALKAIVEASHDVGDRLEGESAVACDANPGAYVRLERKSGESRRRFAEEAVGRAEKNRGRDFFSIADPETQLREEVEAGGGAEPVVTAQAKVNLIGSLSCAKSANRHEVRQRPAEHLLVEGPARSGFRVCLGPEALIGNLLAELPLEGFDLALESLDLPGVDFLLAPLHLLQAPPSLFLLAVSRGPASI